jgi:hypothetical protein
VDVYICADAGAAWESSRLPNVTIQMVPFSVGGHAADGGAFTLLRFDDQDLPDVVYMEQKTSAIYLDKRDDLDRYAAAMQRLCIQAESPKQTVRTLDRMLGELDT